MHMAQQAQLLLQTYTNCTRTSILCLCLTLSLTTLFIAFLQVDTGNDIQHDVSSSHYSLAIASSSVNSSTVDADEVCSKVY